MSGNLLWRAVLIGVVVGFAAWSAYPPEEEINLGLDLQGGMHLVLRVKTEDAVRSETDKAMERLRQELEDEGYPGVRVLRTSDREFEVTGLPRDGDQAVAKIARERFRRGGLAGGPTWDWSREGERLRFTMTDPNRVEIEDQAVRQALQTIRNRIDAFGVSEPVIARQGLGGDRIVVQLPGVDDPERVRDLIKSTAFLELRLVAAGQPESFESREAALAALGGSIPEDLEIFPEDRVDEQGRTYDQVYWVVERSQVITGRDLRSAQPGQGDLGGPVVLFDLTPDGGRRFAEVTSRNVGRKLAVILDQKVQTAPEIKQRISDQGQITGNYTQQEAEDLSLTLRSGALPAGIDTLEERTVGPSLGQDSIDKGLRAGLVGGILVVLLMLIVYKLTGVNAVVALGLDIVLVFGALAAAGATLTLPGIAGIVLTVGMAVDANVLVFERIREELRSGRTVRSAIDAGFSKALSSILDANVTTLIAALFLFQFGTGPIRGFAVTLSIGIFASVFTAVFVSRFLFDLTLARRQRVEKLSI